MLFSAAVTLYCTASYCILVQCRPVHCTVLQGSAGQTERVEDSPARPTHSRPDPTTHSSGAAHPPGLGTPAKEATGAKEVTGAKEATGTKEAIPTKEAIASMIEEVNIVREREEAAARMASTEPLLAPLSTSPLASIGDPATLLTRDPSKDHPRVTFCTTPTSPTSNSSSKPPLQVGTRRKP